MTQTASNYAVVLYDLGIKEQTVAEMKRIFSLTPQLYASLNSPIVSKKEKHQVIGKIFPKEVHNFLMLLSDYHSICELDDIFTAYEAYVNERNDTIKATLYYVTMPTKEQEEKIRKFLCKKYGKKQVKMNSEYKPELLGGFVLLANGDEIDWSMKGRLDKLQRKMIRR